MGCRNLWRLFEDKKYKPMVRYTRHQRGALGGPNNKIRVDVQGSLFSTIRFAYTHCNSLDAAHAIVVERIRKLAARSHAVLYLDGGPTAEKQHTHKVREETRAKALAAAKRNVDKFRERVDNNLRIRKHHFQDVNKQLNKTFKWDPDARK